MVLCYPKGFVLYYFLVQTLVDVVKFPTRVSAVTTGSSLTPESFHTSVVIPIGTTRPIICMERDDIKIVDDEEYAETVLAQVEGIIKKGTRENVGQLFDALSVRHRSERDVLEVKSIFLLPRGGSVIRQRPQPNPNLKVSNSRTSQIKAGSSEKTQGGASFSASVFNLVNNVAGAGILTLAAGKASGTGWIPSIFICSTLAALSAHTFTLIGHACELSGERDFAVRCLKAKVAQMFSIHF